MNEGRKEGMKEGRKEGKERKEGREGRKVIALFYMKFIIWFTLM